VEQILPLQNRLADLVRIEAALSALVETGVLPEAVAGELQLVLEEAFTNIVKYAHADGRDDHPVQLRLHVTPDWLELELVDSGIAFDPFAQAVDQLDRPFEERGDGLMGVPLIRALVDEHHYTRRDGRNHLRLRKRIAPPLRDCHAPTGG
jgi:anti-sigma regulatory factor (Ser/Thr protein kinase)